MSTKSVVGGYSDIPGSLTQESDSLPLRVFAQLTRTANQIVDSISNVAQSILSKCIHIGSLGRYTLDDLKSILFKNQISLESEITEVQADENTAMDKVHIDDLESKVTLDIDRNFEDSSNIDQTSEEVLEEERKRYDLKRQDSLISVTSSLYGRLKKPKEGEEGIYPDLSLLIKKKDPSSYERIQAPYREECSFTLSNIAE